MKGVLFVFQAAGIKFVALFHGLLDKNVRFVVLRAVIRPVHFQAVFLYILYIKHIYWK